MSRALWQARRMQPFTRTRLSTRSALLGAVLSAGLIAPSARAGGVPSDLQTTGGQPAGFADLAARLLPAVVNIAVSETIKPGTPDADDPDDGPNGDAPGPDGDGGGSQSPFPPGSPFEKFFHDFQNRRNPGLDPNTPHSGRRMHALGSGFIIDPAGIVVTNNHVVKDADEITVTLQDNTELKATVLGHDPNTDLAVLKVHSDHPLPAVPLADSDRARVGDLVMAIGNPFGLSGTVTTGIVSSRGRDIHQGQYDDFIQTDAPINRGNSGGPLFNMAGQVIGVNTAIYSSGGGSIGIGFSIPSNEVKVVTAQLIKYGHTRRGWIGVRVQDLSHDLAATMKVSATKGAVVAGVEKDGPAAKAGLKVGDVVLTYGGKAVDGHSLPRLVSETPVGQNAEFGIWRDGRTQTLTIAVAEFPQPPEPKSAPKSGEKGSATTPKSGVVPAPKPDAATPSGPKTPPKAAVDPSQKANGTALGTTGLRYGALDADLRGKANLDAGQGGVAVLDVVPDSPADEHGLAVGDVIVRVDHGAVASPDAFAAAIAAARKAKQDSVLLLVQNADGQEFIPLPLGGN